MLYLKNADFTPLTLPTILITPVWIWQYWEFRLVIYLYYWTSSVLLILYVIGDNYFKYVYLYFSIVSATFKDSYLLNTLVGRTDIRKT